MEKISKTAIKVKTMALGVALAAGLGLTQPAHAFGVPVFDGANLVANEKTAIAVWLDLLFGEEKTQAHYNSTENYYQNFEEHFTNIDESTTNIDRSTTNIDESTTSIDNSVKTIKKLSIINNNYYGDGTDPIPRWDDIPLEKIAGEDAGPMNDYLDVFQNASFRKNTACFGTSCSAQDIETLQNEQVYGVNAQKTANDAMLSTLEFQRGDLEAEGNRLAQLNRAASTDLENTGQRKQMQLALQLANEQGNHLLKLREAMLQSQSAEVVRMQVATDIKAKQVASSQSLRRPVNIETVLPAISSY